MYYKFSYRYLVATKSTNAINIIAWVSIGAIAVVTAAMIIILSVFNGLTHLVKGLYNGFYTNVKVIPATGKVMTILPPSLAALQRIDGVKTVSYIAEEKALLKIGESQAIVTLKGVDDNYTLITSITNNIVKGTYAVGDTVHPKLVLGYGVENALGISSSLLQDDISIYIPKKNQPFTGKIEDFATANATAMGTFAIQQEFDNKYVFTNVHFAKQIIGLSYNQYTAIEIGLTTGDADAGTIIPKIQALLGTQYKVLNKYAQNKSLYTVMTTEKWFVYALFCLVLLIASCTIIGSLTMLVLEKRKDIALLQAMGATKGYIKKIFLYEGVLLAVVGIAIGCTLGIAVCIAQQYGHYIPLSGGSFIIDYYPVRMQWADFVLIISTVFAITVLASYVPATKAANALHSLKS